MRGRSLFVIQHGCRWMRKRFANGRCQGCRQLCARLQRLGQTQRVRSCRGQRLFSFQRYGASNSAWSPLILRTWMHADRRFTAGGYGFLFPAAAPGYAECRPRPQTKPCHPLPRIATISSAPAAPASDSDGVSTARNSSLLAAICCPPNFNRCRENARRWFWTSARAFYKSGDCPESPDQPVAARAGRAGGRKFELARRLCPSKKSVRVMEDLGKACIGPRVIGRSRHSGRAFTRHARRRLVWCQNNWPDQSHKNLYQAYRHYRFDRGSCV